ncbi:PAS/PAC sensor-containing diguanylate cyclase [Novosphingobium sp. Rr 2-17]|uniref:sensor domain-containing diguanylate cyclase n=1 Tax=Novosphingobium sp. Rr 2-17 TaxID=555793 RepID=UPI0002698BBC|nr:sensor domain-containing diguanylate cyclase [Novosphingobium sp. Rr 2-17]EIZ79259.1 PAS/PAC sensor-containing diguanylate cyclase [Novosphingobium sp. Rr 2-17]
MTAQPAAIQASFEKQIDQAIIAVVGYFVLAATTIHLTTDGRNMATMWPADALILALLLRNPRNHWGAILAAGWMGNFLANALTRDWAPGLIFYGAINMTQTCLAAWLITRKRPADDLLADVPTVLRFVLYAGIVTPAAAAAIGAGLSAWNYAQPLVPSFVRWYLSVALGLLIVTPFAMAVLNSSYLKLFRSRSRVENIQAVALQVVNLVVTVAVFGQHSLPLLFLPMTSVVLIAFRIGRLGTILAVMVVGVAGSAAMFLYHPIWVIGGDAAVQQYFFQFYLVIMLVTTLPVATAVSSRSEVLVRLAECEEALGLITAHSPQGLLGYNSVGICQWAQGPLKSYLGVEPEAMIGRSLDALALRAGDVASELLAQGGLAGRRAVFEFSPVLRPALTLEASVGLVRRNGISCGTVVALRDLTRRKVQEVVLLSHLQRDGLTGLVDSPGFRKHLHASFGDGGRQATLALIDIDRFKSINDAHGHAIGDAVLIEICKRLKAVTRDEDVLARVGGDEFAVLLRCDLETARAVCERMVDEVRSAPVFTDGSVSVLASISCGLAEYRPGISPDAVLQLAYSALHALKRSGRNGVRAVA